MSVRRRKKARNQHYREQASLDGYFAARRKQIVEVIDQADISEEQKQDLLSQLEGKSDESSK